MATVTYEVSRCSHGRSAYHHGEQYLTQVSQSKRCLYDCLAVHFLLGLHMIVNSNYFLQDVTNLVKQLHSRDTRRQFCPEGHWLSQKVRVDPEQV